MLLLQDFGLAPGVNEAIVHLARIGRAGAIASLPISDLWPASARTLLPLREHQSAPKLGLKLTLTGAFAPLTAGFSPAFDGSLPNLAHLAAASERFSLQQDLLTGELRAQIRRYLAHMDDQPAFIDLDPMILIFGVAIDAVSEALAHFSLSDCLILLPQPRRGEAFYPVSLAGRVEQFRFLKIRQSIWGRGGQSIRHWLTCPLHLICEERHVPPITEMGAGNADWLAATPSLPDSRLDLFDLHPHWREEHFHWLCRA